MKHTIVETPIGPLTLVGDEQLQGLYFPDHRPVPDRAGFGPHDPRAFAEARTQLAEYFAGERRVFTVPLARTGTAFQQRLWDALAEIPYGEQRTYGELAAALGAPTAVRAVGFANSRNPFAVIVPCHRVVGARGALTGYAGGIEAKRWLLDFERAAVSAEAA